jgi:hypothetical protein
MQIHQMDRDDTQNMSASRKSSACVVVEMKHLKAAEKLIKEVYKDFEALIAHRKNLDGIFGQWRDLMKQLRAVEKTCFEDREPTQKDYDGHKNAVNRMIFAADAIASAATRHLETNYHLDANEQESLRSQIDLVKRHREILAFEFKGWHGPIPLDQLKEGGEKLFRESGRKVA